MAEPNPEEAGQPNIFRQTAATFIATMRIIGRGAVDMATGTGEYRSLLDHKWFEEEQARVVAEADFVAAHASKNYEHGVLAIEEACAFMGRSLYEWHDQGDIHRLTLRFQGLQAWREEWKEWNIEHGYATPDHALPSVEHLFKPDEWKVIGMYLATPEITPEEELL